MLTAISAVTVLPAVVLAQLVGNIWIALELSAAAAFSTYRLGARFHAVATGQHRFVGRPDLAAGLSLIGLYLILHLALASFEALAIAWLVSAILSALLSELPQYERGYRPTQWIRDHKDAIRILLTDSVLLDLGSFGAPLAMSPIFGLANFGTYRGVTSAAMPVRLILNPLRPVLGRRPLPYFVNLKVFLLMSGCALILGASAFGLLETVHVKGWFSGGVLFRLSSFAFPIGCFVALNFIGMFSYLLARAHLGGLRLFLFRIVQLIAALTFPVIGYLWGELTGAIWGLLAAVFVDALFAVILVGWDASRIRRTVASLGGELGAS
jgi:hypothetical protein